MTSTSPGQLELHWFLPTSGDSRSLVGAGQGSPGRNPAGVLGSDVDGFRPPTIDYLADIARTAENLGFEGVLTPTGTFCEDAWLVTPHVEEAWWFGEGVMPRLRDRGLLGGSSPSLPNPMAASA